MAEQKMQVLLGKDKQSETIEAFQILEEMSQEERWELLFFLQGVRFAKRLDGEEICKLSGGSESETGFHRLP